MHLLDTPKERNVRNACFCHLLSLLILVASAVFLYFFSPERVEPADISTMFCSMIIAVYLIMQLQEQAWLWLHPKKPCKYRPHG